jgi:hypothetical protein
VTLRHWTIDKFLFVGEGQQPSAGLVDREVTDGCRLNLSATKIKFILAEVA